MATAWGGRFERPPAEQVLRFTASIGFDRRLYRQDIAGSIAHARMLARQGIISAEDCEQIVRGLEEILAEIERGEFPFRLELEDIHLNIEARLREKVGEVAGRLHTARSRNDQIALDLRLYLKETICQTSEEIRRLQGVLLDLAEAHLEALAPGYTHLQRAQPVLLAHHFLAYYEMLDRDLDRYAEAYRRADVMPLGSGALAGVPYPIDREFVARELGFSRISRNSIDAVSDRDFVLDYLSASAILMVHLSRLAEELVLWSTPEFGFIELDDAYATGSSIMPQKKNPDVAELIRGKAGRVFGHLQGLLVTLKGLPLAYNRDLQEDKEPLFDTVDTVLGCLPLMAGMLATMKVNRDRLARAAEESYALATDLADYLVRKGVPFRDAHQIVGRLVKYAADNRKTFAELSLEEYRKFSDRFEADVFDITVEKAVAARDVPGGTAPGRVRAALAEARARLAADLRPLTGAGPDSPAG
jgi:argininosuccinate lyase